MLGIILYFSYVAVVVEQSTNIAAFGQLVYCLSG